MAAARRGRFSQDRQLAIEAEDAIFRDRRQHRLSPPPADPEEVAEEEIELVPTGHWMRVSSVVKQATMRRASSMSALGTKTPIGTGPGHWQCVCCAPLSIASGAPSQRDSG
jgi:hypothetical protein